MRACVLASIVSAVAACGGSTSSSNPDASTADGGPTACVPNQSIACVGRGGCSGGQACKADGSGYSPCDCGMPQEGGTDAAGDAGNMDSGSVDAPADGTADAGDAGPLSPDQISGLSLWLESSKGITLDAQYPMLVHIWADQSPHGNNASDPGYQEEPLLLQSGYKSFNVVEFNPGGGTQLMNITDDPSLQFGTGDFAVAFVINVQVLQTASLCVKDPQNGLQISADQNINVVTPTAEAHAYIKQNLWHVVVVRGAALEVRVDGMATSGTTNTTDLSAANVGVQFGAIPGANGGSPTIQFLEIAAYKGSVSGLEVAGLEGYWKNKYGL